MTLVPAMTDKAAHVVMLQRSPTYVATVPEEDLISKNLRRFLPEMVVYRMARARNIMLQRAVYRLLLSKPKAIRRLLLAATRRQLGPNVDMRHFQPTYNPWEERMCAVPKGDLFKVIREGKASVVTDHIDTITETGIQLKSGDHLDADVLITATGLDLQLFGGAALRVDGREVSVADTLLYKGLMLEGVPNMALVFGYKGKRPGWRDFLKALYGAATLCVQARIGGHAVGLISNNGPIDVAGANKATHFIQWMCQLGHPLIYLQNTTGYMVGKDSEQGGMIKHGSKMIQAVTNATVPQITIQCGASFGAGNYGMCGRGYALRFLFSWPQAKTAVMGGEQAARTMQIVAEAGLSRKGIAPDPVQMQQQFEQIVQVFESQADAFHTSGLVLDDGVIDPRDTRAVLAFCLDTCAEAAAHAPRRMQFGVARM